MKYDVFLSYNSADAETAAAVEKALQTLHSDARPFKVFSYPTSIAMTEDIRLVVAKAISNSSAVVIIFSNNSAKSNWVHFELGVATGFGVPVMPFTTVDLKAAGETLPPYLDIRVYPQSIPELVKHFASEKRRAESDYRKSLVNLRDSFLSNVCLDAGIADVEIRTMGAGALPPTTLFGAVKDEIVLVGVSLYRLFDQNFKNIVHLLASGRRVYCMLLDPTSPDVDRIQTDWGNATIRREISGVIKKFEEHKLPRNPSFRVRYLRSLPPYTGIMIDGDLEGTSQIGDGHGFVRVQLRAQHMNQHQAPIVQFHNRSHEAEVSAFDIFADDLRKIWKRACQRPKSFAGFW